MSRRRHCRRCSRATVYARPNSSGRRSVLGPATLAAGTGRRARHHGCLAVGGARRPHHMPATLERLRRERGTSRYLSCCGCHPGATAASTPSTARTVPPVGQHSCWLTPPPPCRAVRGPVPAVPPDAPSALPRRAKEGVSAPLLAAAENSAGGRGDGNMMRIGVLWSGGGGSGAAGVLPRLNWT